VHLIDSRASENGLGTRVIVDFFPTRT
jgi:hypothetical protein